MRRLGWVLALAGCTSSGPIATTDDLMLSTGNTSSTTDDSGIHTVTGVNSSIETTSGTDSSSSSGDTQSTSSSSTGGSSSGPGTHGSTTEPVGECGNGIVEGNEECDDGNPDEMDACTTKCKPPGCGDTLIQKGEDCDDGNADNTDACTNACIGAYCGDGFIQVDVEECDDGNDDSSDNCIKTCKFATCGDGFVQDGAEVCDDGFNDGDYNGCEPGCQKLGPHCGDGNLDKIDPNKPKGFEYCDGNMPYTGIGCSDLCLYDFSAAPQLFCAGTCSWGGISGCDQADADIFCRLKTGNVNSKATAYTKGIPTDAGGFPCSNPAQKILLNNVDPRIWLGPLPEFGLGNKDVPYQLSKIKTSHSPYAPDSVILGDATLKCSP